MGKRLVSIEDNYLTDEPVVLRFADGTTATADGVIGADGIHSYTREFMMGKEEAKPTFSGSVAYRGLIPMDLAIEKLGAEIAQNASMICGPGNHHHFNFSAQGIPGDRFLVGDNLANCTLCLCRQSASHLTDRTRQNRQHRGREPGEHQVGAREVEHACRLGGTQSYVRGVGTAGTRLSRGK